MGAGLGSGFFIPVFFFAGVAFFVLFFLRVGAPRFAFLNFFATANLLIGSNKLCQHGTPTAARPKRISAPSRSLHRPTPSCR